MRLYERRLHDVARYVYEIVFHDNTEILSNLDAMIVVNFWDNVLEFFVSDSGKLLLWHRNPNLDIEFLYSISENKFYTKHEYDDVVNEIPLDGYRHFDTNK